MLAAIPRCASLARLQPFYPLPQEIGHHHGLVPPAYLVRSIYMTFLLRISQHHSISACRRCVENCKQFVRGRARPGPAQKVCPFMERAGKNLSCSNQGQNFWTNFRFDTDAWLDLRRRALLQCHPQHQVKYIAPLSHFALK